MEAGIRFLLTTRPEDVEKTRPLEEAELRVNDLSVCRGHGSKGTGMIGSGKTPLTPWQSLPQVICCLPLSFSPLSLRFSFLLDSLSLILVFSSLSSLSVSVFYSGFVSVSRSHPISNPSLFVSFSSLIFHFLFLPFLLCNCLIFYLSIILSLSQI